MLRPIRIWQCTEPKSTPILLLYVFFHLSWLVLAKMLHVFKPRMEGTCRVACSYGSDELKLPTSIWCMRYIYILCVLCVYIYVCVCLCVCVYIYMRVCVCVCVHMYIQYIYMSIYVFVNLCMCFFKNITLWQSNIAKDFFCLKMNFPFKRQFVEVFLLL